MKFEEEFPSFEKYVFVQNGEYEDWCNIIKENCVDKQRAKEVITAYLCNYMCKKNNKIRTARDGILSELGL